MKKMTKLNVQATTVTGATVYASIKVNDDYTMTELVRELKRQGYIEFRLVDSMKRFAKVR